MMPLIQGRNPYIDDEELCGGVDLDGICGRPPLHDGDHYDHVTGRRWYNGANPYGRERR